MEDEEVLPIDDREFSLATAQAALELVAGVDAGKAAAEDQDARGLLRTRTKPLHCTALSLRR